jgi:hypothetical protein
VSSPDPFDVDNWREPVPAQFLLDAPDVRGYLIPPRSQRDCLIQSVEAYRGARVVCRYGDAFQRTLDVDDMTITAVSWRDFEEHLPRILASVRKAYDAVWAIHQRGLISPRW